MAALSTSERERAEWRPQELIECEDWIHSFSAAEISEIDEAAAYARSQGRGFDTLTIEDFPLPTVTVRIRQALLGLEHNRGIYLFRNFLVEERSVDDLRFIFWGLGKHIGVARSQSYEGDVLGDVKDFGHGRLYTTNRAGAFHVDFADVVGLFVLRTAKSGGLTQICSSLAIHNEIARERPDLIPPLFEPVPWSYSRPKGAAGPAYFYMPIMSFEHGRISCLYNLSKIKRAVTQGAPPLDALFLEAMALIESLAQSDAFQLRMMFRPGDLQLINNHVCIHGRTAFEDHEDPLRRRHLLRIWWSVANSRCLNASRRAFGDISAGGLRGGIGGGTTPPVYNSGRAIAD